MSAQIKILAVTMIASMIAISFLPGIAGATGPVGSRPKDTLKGTEGVSWRPMLPIDNAFIVKYDGEGIVDDLAYMAAVPAAVFYSADDDIVLSSPLIFYEDQRGVQGEQLPMNGAQGVEYFMEDWLAFANLTAPENKLMNVQYINFQDGGSDSLKGNWPSTTSKDFTGDAYTMAAEIALYNWRYSDEAVVAIVQEDYKEMDDVVEGDVSGTIPTEPAMTTTVIHGTKEPDAVNPNKHSFNINDGYKFIESEMMWYGPTGSDQLASITQRGRDPDLQLYDMELGEVAASEEWNVLSGPGEYVNSYVFHSGSWQSTVSYMPTKSLETLNPVVGKEVPDRVYNKWAEEGATSGTDDKTQDLVDDLGPAPDKPGSKSTYEITNTLYPGIDLKIPEAAQRGCYEAEFTLSWNGSAQVGFVLRDESGAVVDSDTGSDSPKKVVVPQIGAGNYSAAAIRLDDSTTEIPVTLSYSWHKKMSDVRIDNLASAANGASLASILNVPLLYSGPNGLSSVTKDALNTLGVQKVNLIDLENHGSKTEKALNGMRSWLQPALTVEKTDCYFAMYAKIQALTNTNSIVFTTVDPWTYWHVDKPRVGDEKGGLFIGPATYAAAHHGTAVFVTDAHSALSMPVAWHNYYWADAYAGRYPPSVASMVLTGRMVYNFLGTTGYDKLGMESMLTVADQFDIGSSWDRVFAGAAKPGRIMGSPVDTSYWVARTSLYQAIIFANPAAGSGDISMITGSESRFINGIKVISPEKEVPLKNPVANTWVSYQHRFNERGSLYWNAKYVTASGITPYVTPSGDPIDERGIYPDITTSTAVPYYEEKAGYSVAYTTEFTKTMDNLNRGVIMWLEVMHGGNRGAGVVGFWDGTQQEPNPWRGYEQLGSTTEPDTMVMGHNVGMDVIPNPTPSKRLHDGVIIAIVSQSFQTTSYDGYDFDDNMQNLHSMGFNGGSCLIANTYMHLTMVRHGSSFQVIDPWLTSWYATFAAEMFARDNARGKTVGEAYEGGIRHVGIEYLVDQWWWDIFENVIFYGDPDMHVWSPSNPWAVPEPLAEGKTVGGHAPFGADDHPHAIKDVTMMENLIIGSLIAVAAAVAVTGGFLMRRRLIERRADREARLAAEAKRTEGGTAVFMAHPTGGRVRVRPPTAGLTKRFRPRAPERLKGGPPETVHGTGGQ